MPQTSDDSLFADLSDRDNLVHVLLQYECVNLTLLTTVAGVRVRIADKHHCDTQGVND